MFYVTDDRGPFYPVLAFHMKSYMILSKNKTKQKKQKQNKNKREKKRKNIYIYIYDTSGFLDHFLSKLIEPTRYIIIRTEIVLTIWILRSIVFLHSHNFDFPLIEHMISSKLNLCPSVFRCIKKSSFSRILLNHLKISPI